MVQLVSRPYRGEQDFWRVRAFLRHLFMINDRREVAWQAYRFEYWRCHGAANLDHGPLTEKVILWEAADGDLRAVLNSEAPGYAYLQIDPAVRTPRLLAEMIETATAKLAVDRATSRRLRLACPVGDAELETLLLERGFQQLPLVENYHARALDGRLPDGRPLPPGYAIRALRGVVEFPARSWLSWRAFHPEEPNEAYEGWEWYANIQLAPLYRRELDLVVESDAGKLVAFVTVWFDDVTKTGAFEPVGTHPDYQRRGLGGALLIEGMRRLQARGATLVTVGSGAPGPAAFYTALGMPVRDRAAYWEWRSLPGA